MAKSTIMEMHLCADTAEDLAAASEKAGDINSDLTEVGEELMKVSESLQDASAEGQKVFGSAGDPAASDLFQKHHQPSIPQNAVVNSLIPLWHPCRQTPVWQDRPC